MAEWGEAYVFERQNGVFVETARFRPATARRGDWFGYRVDLRGDRAAVSSYSDGANGLGSGSVWLFEYDGQAWQEVQQLLPSDGHEWGHFGVDVRLGQDEVVVGSHRARHEDGIRGAAYVFRPGPSGWQEVQKVLPIGLPNLAAFGASVAYTERATLLVGAPGVDDGRGRVFELARAADGSYEVAHVFGPGGLAPFDFHGLQVRGDGGEVVASVAHHYVGGQRVGGVSTFTHGTVESTRPLCEADPNPSGRRGLLAVSTVIEPGSDLRLVVSELPVGLAGVVVAALPGSSAPAAVGSCLVGPTLYLGTFVTNGKGLAFVDVPRATLGAWFAPGTTFLVEARARRVGGPALGAPIRTHALEVMVRP